MPPASPVVRISEYRARIIEAELLGRVAHDRRWCCREVFEEHPEQANRSELDGNAQAVAVAAVFGNEGAVGIVEMKIPNKLVG